MKHHMEDCLVSLDHTQHKIRNFEEELIKTTVRHSFISFIHFTYIYFELFYNKNYFEGIRVREKQVWSQYYENTMPFHKDFNTKRFLDSLLELLGNICHGLSFSGFHICFLFTLTTFIQI